MTQELKETELSVFEQWQQREIETIRTRLAAVEKANGELVEALRQISEWGYNGSAFQDMRKIAAEALKPKAKNDERGNCYNTPRI